MDDSDLLAVLDEAAAAVGRALAHLDDWGPAGTRPGQYRSDLVADEAAVGVLLGAGLAVLSEESGLAGAGAGAGADADADADAGVVVVVDPVDGSTNASRGIPWYATSLCALDAEGPRVALVVNQATGTRFEAVRGGGARRDGRPIRPSTVAAVADAVVGLSGYPARPLGWRQYRALGAAALDLCAVASGALDGYVDCSRDAHGVWDYAGGLLVCAEAGAGVVDARGRDLVVRDPSARRTPVAGATPGLLDALVTARRSWP